MSKANTNLKTKNISSGKMWPLNLENIADGEKKSNVKSEKEREKQAWYILRGREKI